MKAVQITWEPDDTVKNTLLKETLFIKQLRTQIQTEFGLEKSFKIS